MRLAFSPIVFLASFRLTVMLLAEYAANVKESKGGEWKARLTVMLLAEYAASVFSMALRRVMFRLTVMLLAEYAARSLVLECNPIT